MPSSLTGPLHQSGAKSLEDCPAKFRAEAEGLDPNFEPFDRGSVIAGIAEVLRYAALDAGADLRAACDAEYAARRHLLPSADARADVESILAGFFTPEFRIDWRVEPPPAEIRLEEPWALNAEFRAVPEDSDDVAFRGRFDVEVVALDELRIEDDKTWAFVPAREEILSDVQARTYALAALARRPRARRVAFQWNLLRHGFPLAAFFDRGAPWEAEHRDWLSRRYEERAKWIALDSWPARPGDGCDTCPVRHRCPELRALYEQGARIPEETPRERSLKLLALKGLVTEYEKAVRRDAAHAPIAIGDGKFHGFQPRNRREVRAGMERKILEDLNLLGVPETELDRFFPRSFSVKGVEAAFKHGDPETWLDWTRAVLEPVKTTQFTTFRIGAETAQEPGK